MNKYQQEVQNFLKHLKELGFPELQSLTGKHFTLNYKAKHGENVCLGGKIESFLYSTSIRRSKKGIVGALIDFRVFTNVLYGVNLPTIEGHTWGFQQEERYKLELGNHQFGTKQISAEWAIRKPRTNEEAVKYWQNLTNTLRLKEDLKEDFRSILMITRLTKNQLKFN